MDRYVRSADVRRGRPSSCGATPDGGTESRTRYRESQVPFGSVCESEQQVSTCRGGAFGSFGGTFAALACSVAPAPSCGAIAHGDSETRIRFEAAAVPYSTSCREELQSRTCQAGTFSDWSGTFAAIGCAVAEPLPCGATPHGGKPACDAGRFRTMFNWWREKQRERILGQPFPEAQLAVLEENIAHYRRMSAEDKRRLRDLAQVFVAEKHWEGCGGLSLTDDMKFTIAAQACMLVLEMPHRLYENVESIFVYPSSVVRPEQPQGIFVRRPGWLASGPIALLGEAHVRGPVVLAWDRVVRDGRAPHHGHNLVYHEFAHKLDMLDGRGDGTPPLVSSEDCARWHRVCERVFLDLRARSQRGERTFIDQYGATNEAEFFAVVTEHFFDQPRELREIEPELYEVLREFYRQDPAAWGAAEGPGAQ